ncbi:MAG: acyltransferase [Betaproteobacteria bacterium]|nr:acyltransferase [Betaproteobacteria bacterium]
MNAGPRRLLFIDALKAIASQLIVLHHLAFYGPMSDTVAELAPRLVGWLSDYGRVAVQAFLVIGGFLAARSLAPLGELRPGNPLLRVWHRYTKLVVPYAAALAVGIAGAAIARAWMHHDSIPDVPTLAQFGAHLLFLHDVLDHEALSAGVWYVAIDFQLFSLMVAILWLARMAGARSGGLPVLGPAVVMALALASLFHFNRDAAWDDWALYFFGSYGLGAAAYWASERRRSAAWMVVMAAVVGAALVVDFRLRIAVALSLALTLAFSRRTGLLEQWPRARPLAFLGRISYSVFLVHFPVCLMVNAAFYRLAPDDPLINAVGMLTAWGASVGAGALLYRFVEGRMPQWLAMIAALRSPMRSAGG